MSTRGRRLFPTAVWLLVGYVLITSIAVQGSVAHAEMTERESQLSRTLHEQLRLHQLAIHGRDAVPMLPLDGFDLPPLPASGLELLARLRANATQKGAAPDDAPLAPFGIDMHRPLAEQLLTRAIKHSVDSLRSSPMTCCLCASASFCSDGQFCNGAETCFNGRCGAGSDPCVDSNQCTSDLCFESTDTCSFPPLPPPAEVASLQVNRELLSPSVAVLVWSSVSGAQSYNVYRSSQPNLGGLACLAGHLTVTTQSDAAIPSQAFLYLITALGCGESTLGSGYPGPRPSPPGCP